MEIEVDLRPRLDQPARAFGEHVGVLTQRVFVEEDALRVVSIVGIVLMLHGGGDVMDRFETFGGFDFDPLDVAVFGETCIHHHVDPAVGPLGGYDLIFRQFDDQIGLLHVPFVGVLELAGSRHIGRISFWGAGVDPTDDGRDLIIGQRHVVLEMADADVLVDVPRRHFARQDFLFDRLGPGPHFLIGQQRHGRESIRPVTDLAAVLEKRRHILRKRDLRLARAGAAGRFSACRQSRDRPHGDRYRKNGSHLLPPDTATCCRRFYQLLPAFSVDVWTGGVNARRSGVNCRHTNHRQLSG